MEQKWQIVTAISLPYFFFCAGLYQLGYWLPFEINAFSFLGLTDILLSFIQPFLYSSFALLFLYGIQSYHLGLMMNEEHQNTGPLSRGWRLFWVISEGVYFITLILCSLLLDQKQKAYLLPWLISIGLFSIISVNLKKEKFLKYRNYRYLIYFFLLLPILSFLAGTRNAYAVFENRRFEYTTNINQQPLKYLGKGSDHFIFVSFDNTQKFFISTGEINSLSLRKYDLQK